MKRLRKAWAIFQTDMKRIWTNWSAAVIIIGLMILPSLYAWFNIEASWDPYGNTKGVAIAITNLDQGATINGEKINMGDEIVQSLKGNHKLGWKFVTKKESLHGVKRGQYYASIIIPENFSMDIASVLSDEPVKATIDYYVNEKINAIAPKITSTGATGLIGEISHQFIKTASETIFSVFNEIGIELQKDLPTIRRAKEFIFRLEQDLPKIREVIDTASSYAGDAVQLIARLEKDLPKIEKLASKGAALSSDVSTFLQKTGAVLEKVEPNIKQDLILLKQTSNQVDAAISELESENLDPQILQGALKDSINRLDSGMALAESIRKTFESIDAMSNNHLLADESSQLSALQSQFEQQKRLLQDTITALNNGSELSAASVQNIRQHKNRAAQILDGMIGKYNNEIAPAIHSEIGKIQDVLTDTSAVLQQAKKDLPALKQKLPTISKGISNGAKEIKRIQKDFPLLEAKLKDIANKIRDFERKQNLEDIIDLLINDVKRESDFVAEPVRLNAHKLFPIPNYGSAMSPFFTTLSLWVGALLLVSLLTIHVDNREGVYRSYHIYFGRFLTFWVIALFQSLIVTIGDMYILNTYVVDKVWFVIFGLLISSLFMLIVYTMVSVFGNVGKAISIILLVLQISGSGGTFPIQMTPAFFQLINPFLPFTYAISLMRETAGGMIMDIVSRDLLILAVYAVITLVIGISLKKFVNRLGAPLVNKAKESKIIH